MQPALPTGTQGEEGIKHGNGVPSPIVGLLGTSGEAGSHQHFFEPRFITEVHMPGSSGDSGSHREYLSEDVNMKAEPGMEASEDEGSPQTRVVERIPGSSRFREGS